MTYKWRIQRVAVAFGAIIALGISGLMLIEGWPFLDALYMTIITLATVGYREVHPLSPAGMVFIILFIILGVGAFLYLITNIAEYVVSGHMRGALEKKKMKKRIEELKGHYVICGFGRVGQHIALELEREKVSFVVIDVSEAAAERCASLGYLFVHGSASDDEALKAAGITKAAGLVAGIDSDAENVYVTLSAKDLKRDLYVVARASTKEAEHKLLRAGADRVISPYSIGGKRLAGMLLRPNVIEFLDLVMHSDDRNLFIEEAEVLSGSSFDGLAIGEARQRCGATLLAIRKKADGRIIPSPAAGVTMGGGDLLIALGTREQLKELDELISGKK